MLKYCTPDQWGDVAASYSLLFPAPSQHLVLRLNQHVVTGCTLCGCEFGAWLCANVADIAKPRGEAHRAAAVQQLRYPLRVQAEACGPLFCQRQLKTHRLVERETRAAVAN